MVRKKKVTPNAAKKCNTVSTLMLRRKDDGVLFPMTHREKFWVCLSDFKIVRVEVREL